MIRQFTCEMLDELLKKAAESPRLRTNLNIHESGDDPVNRLFIAALPGSPFAIQRHPDKWELVTCLRGSFINRTYDDNGKVLTECVMGKDTVTLHIAAGVWHSIEVLEPCVFLEVKPGPYVPVAPEDTLDLSK